MNGLEDKIRQRAYELWEQSGKTDIRQSDVMEQSISALPSIVLQNSR